MAHRQQAWAVAKGICQLWRVKLRFSKTLGEPACGACQHQKKRRILLTQENKEYFRCWTFTPSIWLLFFPSLLQRRTPKRFLRSTLAPPHLVISYSHSPRLLPRSHAPLQFFLAYVFYNWRGNVCKCMQNACVLHTFAYTFRWLSPFPQARQGEGFLDLI